MVVIVATNRRLKGNPYGDNVFYSHVYGALEPIKNATKYSSYESAQPDVRKLSETFEFVAAVPAL